MVPRLNNVISRGFTAYPTRLKTVLVIIFLCFNISLFFGTFSGNVGMVESTDVLSSINMSSSVSDSVNLTILHINDLHGWLNPRDGIGGVASYMGYFQQEGFDPNEENSSFLLLSGGDQNTGPATATLSKGEAVIDVMNAMGFDAACIGNHEFDYGVEWIYKRKTQANFPILSSNIYNVGTMDLANFSVPWTLQNHSGVNVGIIGLTTQSTYTSAHPKVTSNFDFGDYEAALRAHIPVMRAAGAELVIVLAHCTPSELSSLASDVSDLDISVFLGGHGGTATVTDVGESIVAMAAHKSRQYVKIELSVNRSTGEVFASTGELIDNTDGGVTPDTGIQTTVDQWDAQINAGEIITYTSEDIYDSSTNSGISALVTDAFIHYFNYTYNFGITNRGGGFRDYFRQGNISIADIVSVIPFENNLMIFNITGEDLAQYTYFSGYARSGLKQIGDDYYIQENGVFTPLDPSKNYTGIICDYPWYVNYQSVFNASDTGIHYRDTVFSYFRELDDLALHESENRTLFPLYNPPSTSTTDTTSQESTENTSSTNPTTTNTTSAGSTGVDNALLLIIVSLFIFSRKMTKKN